MVRYYAPISTTRFQYNVFQDISNESLTTDTGDHEGEESSSDLVWRRMSVQKH